jgi:two-component sensor histidine kinase/DNA-binding response OmpR family regulator
MIQRNPVNILLVDDQPGKLLSYEVMLKDLGENLIPTSSAQEALTHLLKTDIALILVDVCMPDLDGFELAKMIREHPRYQKTAMIFISAIHLSESDFLRGYEAGAVDYVSVPVVPELLRAKVRVFAELHRKTRQLESLNRELEQRVAERTAALEASAEQLRKSEQGRSLALAAGNMGSWDFDPQTGVRSWDQGQRHIFGIEDAAFVPSLEKFYDAIYPDDRPQLRQALGVLSAENGSCDCEARIVRPNGEMRWCHFAVAASYDGAGLLTRMSGVTTDITERKEAETRQVLLAREVDHRARNALAVVQAIVRLARRDSIEDYIRTVEGRIGALAHTHELLSRARWLGADILRLILEELAPYRREGSQQATAIGPSIMISPENAQTVAVALHELATNAAKYGALSRDTGRVDVRWSLADGLLTLVWTETGGPLVEPPKSRGFGTKIITATFGRGEGQARFDWRPEGLQCTIVLPCEKADTGAEACSPLAQRPAAATTLLGRRILLVEDEAMVGMFMYDLLEDMGLEPTRPFTRLADAMAEAARQDFDGAILDINLNGELVYPLADVLAARDIPVIFVTGYASESLEPRFAGKPVLQKPVVAESLEPYLARDRSSVAIRA